MDSLFSGQSRSESGQVAGSDRPRSSVLIVDSDPVARVTIAALISAAGCVAHQVDHIGAAIRKVDDWQPSVVLLGVSEPGGVGASVAELHNAAGYAVPVILMASKDDLGAIFGVVGYLPKPFDVRDLLAILSRYVSCFATPSDAG